MTDFKWVFITPRDVWMFRDNKPFAAGQSFVARSLFPPTPQTVQGFLRTQYLESRGVDFGAYGRGDIANPLVKEAIEQIGRNTSTKDGKPTLGNLRVAGAFIARKTGEKDDKGETIERLFRAPLDVQFKPNDPKSVDDKPTTLGTFRQFSVDKSLGYQTNTFSDWRPLIPPAGSKGTGEKWDEAKGWLTEDAFRAYLVGDIASHHTLIPSSQVYQMEERPGIALETARRTTRDSHFYHAQFVRPNENVGLLVGSTVQIFQKDRGSVMIGGESRFGDFDSTVKAPAGLQDYKTGKLRVVLLTPAYFDGGWGPSNQDWSHWVDGGKLVSAALGKPQLISGWDMVKGEPKPLRHYLPAGSVFYFENANWKDQPFTQTPDNEPDFGAMGYGQVALGTW